MNKLIKLLTSALAAVVLSSGFAGTSAASTLVPSVDSGASGNIQGGGASFPNDQYQKWITDITAAGGAFGSDSASKLVLTYTKSSSGTGKANFVASTGRTNAWMFSGSDSLLSAADRKKAAYTGGYVVVPMTAGPLAVITHLPGISANIKLNAQILCGIYAGDIKSWNDAAIVKLNPSLASYSHGIVPVARDATSGTTFIFASYLATGASAAQRFCSYTTDWNNAFTSLASGTGTLKPADAIMATRFSAMRTAKGAVAIASKTGNDGIRDYVNATDYSIGYVEMAYSFAASVKTAALATYSKYAAGKNKGKPAYLLPTTTGATNALAAQNAVSKNAAINPALTFLQPVNQKGLATYPVVGYSWVLLYKNYDPTIANAPSKGQVQGLVYFLNWALTKGGVYTAGGVKCYAPLPATVKAAVIAQLKTITYGGATVWK